jgi:hypothetical protein
MLRREPAAGAPQSELRPKDRRHGLGAVETMQGTDTTPRVFQMPDEAGDMASFSAFDLDKRVKALRAALWEDDGAKPEFIKPVLRDQA